MSDYLVRCYSVFAEGRKVGQMHTVKLSIDGGDAENFGDQGGIVVWSDGVITSKCTASVYEPISGLDFPLEDAMLNKTLLNMTFGLINGRLYSIRMKLISMEHDGTIRDGKLEGSFVFGGGKPTIQGLV